MVIFSFLMLSICVFSAIMLYGKFIDWVYNNKYSMHKLERAFYVVSGAIILIFVQHFLTLIFFNLMGWLK